MAQLGVSATFTSVGPQGVPDIGYSNGFFVIQSPWGVPNVPTPCTSFADFVRKFGGLSKLTAVASGLTADTYTVETDDDVVQGYYAVKHFFAEKGANSPGIAWVTRVIQSSSPPTRASATFADQTTNNTTIQAKWHGRDGGTVQVYIINPSPLRGVFTIGSGTVAVTSGMTTVTCSGSNFTTGSTWVGYGIKIGVNYYTIASVTNATTLELDENASATETAAVWSVGNNTTAARLYLYHPRSNRREEWDLEPTLQSAADISRRSELVNVTLPAGLQLPKTTAPGASGASKLNAGSAATADSYNASDADIEGSVSAANVKTGLQVFNDIRLGGGTVAIPGKTSAGLRTALNTHCGTYYRMGMMGGAASLTLTTARTEFALYGNYLTAYVPRLIVTDENSGSGGGMTIDPVGPIMGLACRMDRDNQGPHKSPAGPLNPLLSVRDVETASDGSEIYDDAASNTLADEQVNTIRRKNGVVVWGLRTRATDSRYLQINQARTISLVYYRGILLLEKYFTEVLDPYGRLFSRIRGDLNSMLEDMRVKSSLFGEKPGNDPGDDDAYFVVCSRDNNPNVNLSKGEIRADVSFVPAPNVERITLNLYPAAVGFGSAAASQAA